MIDPLLSELLVAPSPPGNEQPTREILVRELAPFGRIVETRWSGFYMSLKGNKDNGSRPKVVLTAHMDAPGFIVRSIGEDGRLDLIHLGGINPRVASPRSILLRSGKKRFDGVITANDPSAGRNADYTGFFGFRDRKQAESRGVKIGDPVAWSDPPVELQNGYVATTHADNRLGCWLLCHLAEALSKSKRKPAVDLYFAATGCEEIGGRGARIMGQMIEPDLALCFDATYELGEVKMGAGPCVTISDASVILPVGVRDRLTKRAKKKKIPLQYEVYNYSGTDASGFREVGSGCLTICPLVPSLNNHTPREIFKLSDLEATAALALEIVADTTGLLAAVNA